MAAGLYIHVPFCVSKCPYCDFYSTTGWDDALLDAYTQQVIREMDRQGYRIEQAADTLYFGGGTPSVLGGNRLANLIGHARARFGLREAEITLEANPAEDLADTLKAFAAAGGNRVSLGMQSACEEELSFLGRRHTPALLEKTVADTYRAGIHNLSLDLMLGLPNSSCETLKKSLDFLINLNPEHISAYILKIEENTKFYKNRDFLNLPDDDGISDQYLYMCEYLENNGFCHYEISNFCKDNKASRHNLKYWKCEEYLGLGPSAHSFLKGKRFFYPRDLKAFIKGNSPTPDGDGGDKTERIMLALRLKDGIKTDILSPNAVKKCELFAKNGLAVLENGIFSLTNNGMLLSNTIICEILEEF